MDDKKNNYKSEAQESQNYSTEPENSSQQQSQNQNIFNKKDVISTLIPGQNKENFKPNYLKAIIYGIIGLVLGIVLGYFAGYGIFNISPLPAAALFGVLIGVLFAFLGSRARKDANKFEKLISTVLLILFIINFLGGCTYLILKYAFGLSLFKKVEQQMSETVITIKDVKDVGSTFDYGDTKITLVKVEENADGAAKLGYFKINPKNDTLLLNSYVSSQNLQNGAYFQLFQTIGGTPLDTNGIVKKVNNRDVSMYASSTIKANKDNNVVVKFFDVPPVNSTILKNYLVYSNNGDKSIDQISDEVMNKVSQNISNIELTAGLPIWIFN